MREAAMPQVKSAASKPVSPQQKLSNLYQQIDTAGKGSITKVQFQLAFDKLNPPPAVKAMGAEAVFSKLDPSGSGSVSKQDFLKGMEAVMAQAKSSEVGAQAKAAPAPAPKELASVASASGASGPASPPAQVGSGSVGNTINITA